MTVLLLGPMRTLSVVDYRGQFFDTETDMGWTGGRFGNEMIPAADTDPAGGE